MDDISERTKFDLLRRLVLATEEVHYKVLRGCATEWRILPIAIVVQEEANILRLDAMWLVPGQSASASTEMPSGTHNPTPTKL